jgi:hypothetical protein
MWLGLRNPAIYNMPSSGVIRRSTEKKSAIFSGSVVNRAFVSEAVKRPKKDARQEYATREDVERAVDGLSRADELRLEKYARYRVRGLRNRTKDHEDLLREAITSTWIGAGEPDEGRRWRKNEITFVQHVIGSMRSVASHWKRGADRGEALLDSDLAVEAEGGGILSPVDNAPSQAPDQERVLLAKEQLGAVYRLFQNDDDAALVLEGIREGWTGPEIIDRLALPKNRYEAALKRIRYHVK